MNLCGEFVTHKVFGRGQISEQGNDCLTVLFGKKYGEKRFIYPTALGTFLIPENALIIKQLEEDRKEIARQKAAAQKEAEERLAEEKRAENELAKISKKAATKKAAKPPVKKAAKATDDKTDN